MTHLEAQVADAGACQRVLLAGAVCAAGLARRCRVGAFRAVHAQSLARGRLVLARCAVVTNRAVRERRHRAHPTVFAKGQPQTKDALTKTDLLTIMF